MRVHSKKTIAVAGLAIAVSLLPVTAAAQDAPAPGAQAPAGQAPAAGVEPPGFSGSAVAAVSVESGQTDLSGVQLSFQSRRAYSPNGATTAGATYQHGTTRTPDTRERITVANHADAQFGVEHTFASRWVLMARTEALRDTIQQIDYRFNEIVGMGPRMQKGRLVLRVIPGVAFLTHDKNVASENGFNVNYGVFQDATVALNQAWSFSQSFYTSRDVSDDNDYFLSVGAQLTGAITRRLGIQFSYLHTYESLLPVGVDPRYQKTMIGLQLTF